MKEPVARAFLDQPRLDGPRPRALPAFGDDGLSFGDLLDIVNPLQHLPVIGTLYREITGDTIDPGAKMLGSGLYGGPIGFALAGADVIFEAETGADMGATIMAGLFGDGEPAPDNAVAALDLPIEPAAPPPSPTGNMQATAAPLNLAPARASAAPSSVPELTPDSMALLLQAMGAPPEAMTALPISTPPRTAPGQGPEAYAKAMDEMQRNLDRYWATAKP